MTRCALATPRALATRPRARQRTRGTRARGVEDARADARADWVANERFDDVVLRTWEARAPFFWPRFAVECALCVGLGAAIPVSVGDVVRGGGWDAARALALNVGGLGATAALARADAGARTGALRRLAKELALQKMVVIQRNTFFEEQAFALGELRGVARVAVVYGDAKKVERDLQRATSYRRRLEQSRILVVPVVERGMDGSSGAIADVGPGRWELLKDVVETFPGSGAGRWLAWPTRNDDWSAYFRRLIKAEDVSKGGYLTISTSGLIRGSGVGSPDWSVLLSTFPRNRPGNREDEEAEKAWRRATLDASEALETKTAGTEIARGGGRGAVSQPIPRDDPAFAPIIGLHEQFYKALDSGDEESMAAMWRSSSSRPSSLGALVERGARLDGWDVVLRPDRRPQGMKVSDIDITIEKGVATLTGLETVANGATLLCTQTFERDENSEWMLTGHTTIPYGADVVAKIVLCCDASGCVAVPAKSMASSSS